MDCRKTPWLSGQFFSLNPNLPMAPQQLKELPTYPPAVVGKYRVDIEGECCQVWEHRRAPCGNIISVYISTHPPVVGETMEMKRDPES